MNDRFIRASAAATVVAIGAIAAYISYMHALDVATAHGETGATGRLVPLTIDGLVYVASMVLLDSARRRVPAPALARLALALGIVATIAANLAHGVDHGPVGALVAAWPAVTLILTVELLMGLIRARQDDRAEVPAPAPLDAEPLAEPWTGGPVGMEWWDALPAVESGGESAPGPVATALPKVPDGEPLSVTNVTVEPVSPVGDTGAIAPTDPVVATARERFAEVLATGALPSVRALRRELRIGHPRAVRVRAALEGESARESAPALF